MVYRQTKFLYIHGEVGKNNLILGYPEGDFSPGKYQYDVRQKEGGPIERLTFESILKV